MAKKGNNTARWASIAVVLVLALLSLAVGWGQHQATLSSHGTRLTTVETCVRDDYQQIKTELSELSAGLARIEGRLNGDHRRPGAS